MADLDKALVDIRSIRRQVAATTEFHGYGPATLFATAGLAILTGLAQARYIPTPAEHPSQYVGLWLTTGIVCAALIATQMLTRANRLHSGMADEMVRMAVAQFLPAAVTGAVLPWVLLHVGGNLIWMLPGLWQVVFGLGVFASCRCLPRQMVLAGVWFVVTGLGCIALGDSRSLAPVTMAGAYGVGMTLVGAIHYFASDKAENDED